MLLWKQSTSTSHRRPPRLFSRDGLLCAALLGFALLATWPVAEIGINDDWSYTRTAQVFAQTHHFVYNGWATAMLGWQVVWGALFAWLFGPTYTSIRLSTLPVALATALLYHAILRRFALNRAHALFGTLTLVLGPLFLPLSDTFMSDIPGLFSILLCIYLCQRALAAQDDNAARLWLVAAAVTNVLSGSVRQIAWLGLLVIVPSCAYLLRRRRHVLPLTALLWIAGALSIRATLQWFNRQPYAAIEILIPRHQPHNAWLMHLGSNLWRTPLETLLFCVPVLSLGLAGLSRPRPRQVLGLAVLSGFLLALWLALPRNLSVALLPPWLGNIVSAHGIMQSAGLFGSTRSAPPWILFALLLFLAICVATCIQTIASSRHTASAPETSPSQALSWRETAFLLLPFLAAYCALLVPRAASTGVFDRYLLEIVAILLIFMLRWHQEHVGPHLPAVSSVVLAIVALVTIASTHDLFSMDRARVRLLDSVQQSGIPRTAIRGGFEFDTISQVDAQGYVNDPHIRNPPGAYQLHPEAYADTSPCHDPLQPLIPAVHPVYAITADPTPCLGPSPFPPVTFRTWLPPATRQLFIGRVMPPAQSSTPLESSHPAAH